MAYNQGREYMHGKSIDRHKPTDIHIETGFDDNDIYCLFASTPKHEYRMALNVDNIGDTIAMLNNAIVDMMTEERRMLANRTENEE